MKIFGEKEKIQIAYRFKESPFDDEIGWGEFQFYINNKDVCEIIRDGKKYKYEWNLIYLIDWVINNIEYIIGYDPFPFSSIIRGDLNIMLDFSENKDIETDIENFLWYGSLSDWKRRHTWASNDDGSCISRVFFYRREQEIEISWNNKNRKCGKVQYSHLVGSEKFEIEYFKTLFFNFIENIISDLKNIYPNNKYILELEKKINFWLFE